MASQNPHREWKLRGEKPLVQTPWFQVGLADVELPDGRRIDHYLFRVPPVVLTAVLDDQDRVLLVWRYRFIPGSWGWELPSGLADPTEDLAAAAARETLKETGWEPESPEPLLRLEVSAGLTDSVHHVYWTSRARPRGQPGFETVRMGWMPLGDMPAMIDNGEIRAASTAAALLMIGRAQDTRRTGLPGENAGALAFDYREEDVRLVQRSGQHDAALDGGDNLDRGRPRGRLALPIGAQGGGQRRDPLLEVAADHGGEPVALPAKGEGALQADAPTGPEIVNDRVEHGGYRDIAGWRAPQRFEDSAGEPGVDVGQHRRGHLVLAAGEEMVEAALPEPGRLAQLRDAGALEPMLPERLGQRRHGRRAVGHHPGHLTGRGR